ncbi:MAG: DUF6283 family protein [Solirubrobacteraceae bacterium]|jgi:hypothetical protein
MSIAPTKYPCPNCPYRKDVPSGVWAPEEYDKLPAYDNDTPSQPLRAFYCHLNSGRLCSGWVGCHDMDHSLGLRMMAGRLSAADYRTVVDYSSPVALFESGAAAAEHGRRDIEAPTPAARRAIDKLIERRARRQP